MTGVASSGGSPLPLGEGSAPLQLVVPPDGVTLVDVRRSKTGEGGEGVLARYSDGTTCSAMVNSDGSVTILFFRGVETLPAIPVSAGASASRRFTWATKTAK